MCRSLVRGKGHLSLRCHSVTAIQCALSLFRRRRSISKFLRRESEESGPEVPIIVGIYISLAPELIQFPFLSASHWQPRFLGLIGPVLEIPLRRKM
jgi:hypothetical protein